MTVRVGTSGWSYDHWTGVLYPPGLASARRLSRYVEEFDTVELNPSFYISLNGTVKAEASGCTQQRSAWPCSAQRQFLARGFGLIYTG